jgi:protein TonB
MDCTMDRHITPLIVTRPEPPAALHSRPRLITVAAVIALHVVLIAALCAVVHPTLPAPPPQLALNLVFGPPAEPTLQPLATAALPAEVQRQTARLAPIARLFARHPEITRAAPVPALQHAAAPAEAVTATPNAAGAPSPAPDLRAAFAAWESSIRRAVQNAAIYPPAARRLRRQGSARVRFDYDEGTVEEATIETSSHVAALDRAALAAVTTAAMPRPPAELGRQKHPMLVWVRFALTATD